MKKVMLGAMAGFSAIAVLVLAISNVPDPASGAPAGSPPAATSDAGAPATASPDSGVPAVPTTPDAGTADATVPASTDAGTADATVPATKSACGNGKLEDGEECDGDPNCADCKCGDGYVATDKGACEMIVTDDSDDDKLTEAQGDLLVGYMKKKGLKSVRNARSLSWALRYYNRSLSKANRLSKADLKKIVAWAKVKNTGEIKLLPGDKEKPKFGLNLALDLMRRSFPTEWTEADAEETWKKMSRWKKMRLNYGLATRWFNFAGKNCYPSHEASQVNFKGYDAEKWRVFWGKSSESGARRFVCRALLRHPLMQSGNELTYEPRSRRRRRRKPASDKPADGSSKGPSPKAITCDIVRRCMRADGICPDKLRKCPPPKLP